MWIISMRCDVLGNTYAFFDNQEMGVRAYDIKSLLNECTDYKLERGVM